MSRQCFRTTPIVAIMVIAFGIAGSEAAYAQDGPQRVPRFEVDPLFFRVLPDQWVTGQVGGLAVDPHDNIWVLHRPATIPDGERAASLDPPQAECCYPAPPVLQFSPNGEFIQAWGGAGQGFEWPSNEHGIFVDHEDNIWISGSSGADNQILKFTSTGEFILQIGRAGMNEGSNDTLNVGGPADLFVHRETNELFVADGYGNRRIIVFDAETGAYKRHWGAYGNRPDDDYELPTREELVREGPSPTRLPQFNTPVHAVYVTHDDLVYVADRGNLRFQVFNLDGTFVEEKFVKPNTLYLGTVHEFGTSPDPEQTYLYIVDGANKYVHVLDRSTLTVLYSVGGHAGHNAREFFHIHSFATDSNGNWFLGEVNDGQRYYRYRYIGMGPLP